MIPSSDEIEEELRAHIAARAADLEKRRGLSPGQALREARLEFGSVHRYVEEGREARGWQWVDLLRSSFTALWRSLRRSPAFAMTAVGTLTLGIGIATLLFSLAYGVLVTPLAYPDQERLYNIRITAPSYSAIYRDLPVSALHFAAWRRGCSVCESIALIDGSVFNLVQPPHREEPRRVTALTVTPEFLRIVGLPPAFRDEGPNARPVALVTHRFWQTQMGADPRAVGRRLELNGVPTEVIAILPKDLPLPQGEQLGEMMQFPPRIDLLLPSRVDAARQIATDFRWSALVKLRPGVTQAVAQAQFEELLAPLSRAAALEMHAQLVPLHQQITQTARQPIILLAWMAAFLLTIVCSNFGNLQLARTLARQKELAIHATLGAGRAGLLRHLLSESLALVTLSGCIGLAMACAGLWLLRWWTPCFLPRMEEVVIHPVAWLAVLSAVAITGALGALTPLWRTGWRAEAQAALDSRGSSRFHRRPRSSGQPARLQHSLMFCGVASSVVLTYAAVGLHLDYARLLTTDLGFSSRHVSTFHISVPPEVTSQAHQIQRHRSLLTKLRALPGVEAAAISSRLPLLGETWVDSMQRRAGLPQGPMANWRLASTDYFRTIGTPLRSGREFTEADRGQHVAILSERAAQVLFPHENPLGQTILQPGNGSAFSARIVGIAADVKAKHIDALPPPMAYLPDWLCSDPDAFYLLRSRGDAAELDATVQKLVSREGMELPSEWIAPMQRFIDLATASHRWQGIWVGLLASAGLATVCLSLFGVVAFQVSRKIPEIAVRVALGASRRQAAQVVLHETMRPVWQGLLAGTALSLAVASRSQAQFFELLDPWFFLAAPLAVALLAFGAIWWSILRAVDLHPAPALRAE